MRLNVQEYTVAINAVGRAGAWNQADTGGIRLPFSDLCGLSPGRQPPSNVASERCCRGLFFAAWLMHLLPVLPHTGLQPNEITFGALTNCVGVLGKDCVDR